MDNDVLIPNFPKARHWVKRACQNRKLHPAGKHNGDGLDMLSFSIGGFLKDEER